MITVLPSLQPLIWNTDVSMISLPAKRLSQRSAFAYLDLLYHLLWFLSRKFCFISTTQPLRYVDIIKQHAGLNLIITIAQKLAFVNLQMNLIQF